MLQYLRGEPAVPDLAHAQPQTLLHRLPLSLRQATGDGGRVHASPAVDKPLILPLDDRLGRAATDVAHPMPDQDVAAEHPDQ